MTSAANAARAGALVVERPKRGTLSITGPDRCTWLNGVITAEVASLKAGQGRWGPGRVGVGGQRRPMDTGEVGVGGHLDR